jgi:hypothetical protein
MSTAARTLELLFQPKPMAKFNRASIFKMLLATLVHHAQLTLATVRERISSHSVETRKMEFLRAFKSLSTLFRLIQGADANQLQQHNANGRLVHQIMVVTMRILMMDILVTQLLRLFA